MLVNWGRRRLRREVGSMTSSSVLGLACAATAVVVSRPCKYFARPYNQDATDTSSGARRQLTFPAVPASLPAEFTNLTALENLEIVGGNKSPGTFHTSRPCRRCTDSTTTTRSWPVPGDVRRFDRAHHFTYREYGARPASGYPAKYHLPDPRSQYSDRLVVTSKHLGWRSP